jgi:hypothetical protein
LSVGKKIVDSKAITEVAWIFEERNDIAHNKTVEKSAEDLVEERDAIVDERASKRAIDAVELAIRALVAIDPSALGSWDLSDA